MLFPTSLDLSVLLDPSVFRRCIHPPSSPLHSHHHSRNPWEVLGQSFYDQSGALFPLRGFSTIYPPLPRNTRNNGKMQRNSLFHAGPRIGFRSPRHSWWKEKVNLLFSDLDMRGSGYTEINFIFFLDRVSL